MPPSFLELFVITPKPGTSFTSPETKQDLQWILNQCMSGRGGISFSFRQSATNADQLLLVSCWASKADHDDLDIRGVTPKLLKVLMGRVTMPPNPVYFLSMEDEERKGFDFEADVLGVKAWFVRGVCRGVFQEEVERRGVKGAWCVEKGVAPKPLVMPDDEVELKIIEAAEKRAKARLEVGVPDVWVSFETGDNADEMESFGHAVKDYVEKVEGGDYGKFLSG